MSAPRSPEASATVIDGRAQPSRRRRDCGMQSASIAWLALLLCAIFLLTLAVIQSIVPEQQPKALTTRWRISRDSRRLAGTIGACVCASQTVSLLFSAGASTGIKRSILLAAALFCCLCMTTFALDSHEMLFHPWSLELSIFGLVASSSMLGYYITGSLIRLQKGVATATSTLREGHMWSMCCWMFAWPTARYVLELWSSTEAVPVAAGVDAVVLAVFAILARRAMASVFSVLNLHWTVGMAGWVTYLMWITADSVHFLVAAGFNIPSAWILYSLTLFMLSITTLMSMYITQALISFEEITRFKAERDAAHAELATRIQQQQQAQAAEEARQKFLRYIFHEIRVPFNSIDMGLGMLVEDIDLQAEAMGGEMVAALNGGIILPEDAKATIEIMAKAAASMKVIINDTLDWTKLQSGAFQISLGATRLADVVSGTMVGLSAFAMHPDNRVKLVQEIDPHLPPWLLGDKVRLQQVVANFLSNAIKFAPHDGTGVVTLKVHVLDGGAFSDWTDPLGMVQPVKDFPAFHGAGIWWKESEHEITLSPVLQVDSVTSAQPILAGLASLSNAPSASVGKSPAVHGPSATGKSPSGVGVDATRLHMAHPTLSTSTSPVRRAPSFHHVMQEAPAATGPPALRTGGWSKVAGTTQSAHVGDPGAAHAGQEAANPQSGPYGGLKRISGSVRNFGGTSPSTAQKALIPDTAADRKKAQHGQAQLTAALPELQAPEIQPALIIKNMLEGFSLRPAGQGGSVVDVAASAGHPRTSVTTGESVRLKEEQLCTLVISVQDNGDGIAADEVPTLFRAFKQLDAGMQYKGKGTGLGLAICHEIVSLHGGRVGVRSSGKRGGGAEFLIALRLPVLIRDGPHSARSGTRDHTLVDPPSQGLPTTGRHSTAEGHTGAVPVNDFSARSQEQHLLGNAHAVRISCVPSSGLENVLMPRTQSLGVPSLQTVGSTHGGGHVQLPGTALSPSQSGGSRRSSLVGQQGHPHAEGTGGGGLSVSVPRRFSAHLADDRHAGVGAGPPALLAGGSPTAAMRGNQFGMGQGQAQAALSVASQTSRVRAMVEEDALRMRSPAAAQLSPETRTREVHEEMMRRATVAAQLAAEAMADPDSLVIPLGHGLHGTLTVGSGGARMMQSMSLGLGATAADVAGMAATPGQTSALPCMCVPGATGDVPCLRCQDRHRSHSGTGSTSSTFRLTQAELDRLVATEGLLTSPLSSVVRSPVGLPQSRGSSVHSTGTPPLALRAPSLSVLKGVSGRSSGSTGSGNPRTSHLQYVRGPSMGSNGPGDTTIVFSGGPSTGVGRTFLPLPAVPILTLSQAVPPPPPQLASGTHSTSSGNSRGDTPGATPGATEPAGLAAARRAIHSSGSDVSHTVIPTMPPMGEHPREPSGWNSAAGAEEEEYEDMHEALVVQPSVLPGGLAPFRSTQPFTRKLALSTIEEIATPGLPSTVRSLANLSAKDVRLGASGVPPLPPASAGVPSTPSAPSPTVAIPVMPAPGEQGTGQGRADGTLPKNPAGHDTWATSVSSIAGPASSTTAACSAVDLHTEPQPGPVDVAGPDSWIGSRQGRLSAGAQAELAVQQYTLTQAVQSTGSAGASSSSDAAVRVLRILMVDDVADNRRLLHRVLKRRLEAMLPKQVAPVRWRVEVDEAEDGHIAVEMVTGRPVQNLSTPDCPACDLGDAPDDDAPPPSYDVITMDAEMPVLSGFRATQLIRAFGYSGLILGCTGNALEEDQQLFKTRGANEIYIKPLDIGAIATAVCAHLAAQDAAAV